MHDNLLVMLELLVTVTAVAMAARHLRMPYGTALVVTGLVMTYFHVVPHVELDAEIVINVFLPILLFEAAINTDAGHLREEARPVGLLATLGFAVMAGVTGAVLHGVMALDWPTALLMGTMFSITDTVAVLAVFKSLKVPPRLAILVEGESLFNDGTALVFFRVLLAVVVTGAFDPVAALWQVFVVSLGGAATGAILGLLASTLLQQTEDHLTEIAMTTLLALGTYFAAEYLHFSGVIAVVLAGLVVGNYGWQRALAPTSQIALGAYWEYLAFGVNSAIFLLVGLNIQLAHLVTSLPFVAASAAAVLLGRVALIYPCFRLMGRLDPRPLPLAWQHVMVWGNMKGSLTMVLALSLPASMPHREMILTVTFGLVLASLVVQGLTLGPLIRALKVSGIGALQRAFQEQHVLLIRARAAQSEIRALTDAGILSKGAYERMRARYQVIIAGAERELRRLGTDNQAHWDATLADIEHRVLMVEKVAVIRAMRENMVSEEVGGEALVAIDERLVVAEQQGLGGLEV